MSKEEFLKTQTCVLKVNIHCEGCKAKVKKILHKIEGVYTTAIDSELGKVTVSGNVDPATLIKKLNKNGKFAEIWGAAKPSNTQVSNQMKNLQIGNGKGGNNNKNQPQKGTAAVQPKGAVAQAAQNPQQFQQMKGFQDLKTHPQNMKMAAAGVKDQKSVKFSLPEEEGLSDEFESDDEFDDFDDDDEDDEFEDEIGGGPVNKMKPVIGNNQQMANVMMKNMMNAQQQGMKQGGGKKAGPGPAGSATVHFNLGGNVNSNDAGGKKGKGGKNGGGPAQDGKPNKNAGHGGGAPNPANSMAKEGMMMMMMNDGPSHGMPNMMPMNAAGTLGPMAANPAMAMAHPHHMNQMAAGKAAPPPFPAGHFPVAAERMPGIPYQQQQQHQQQQQYAAMMMNMQRANGNERFQPMVYARPPPAVSYMPSSSPYPYPYPYYPPPPRSSNGAGSADEYSMFSDENTQSCAIM